MLSIPNELSDLATIEMIEIEDREISPAALEHSSAKSWFYYFPLLWKTSKSHFLLYEQVDGAILIYRLRAEQERLRLSLFLPPFPFHPAPACTGTDARLQSRPDEPDRTGPGKRGTFGRTGGLRYKLQPRRVHM
jgi:hypothetical protein